MIARAAHGLLHWYYSRRGDRFASELQDPELVQRRRLAEILKSLATTENRIEDASDSSYEELINFLPVSDYEAYRQKIELQRKTGRSILADHVVRFEPTSGSTEARKWIPYSKDFLNEINQAAACWLGDLYENFPGLRRGVHYWSLSWLPEELRQFTSSDDSELFPFYQRWILARTQAVPSVISTLKDHHLARWATLVFLASRTDLSLVSVWSPTFWLQIAEDLKKKWPQIREVLETGHWGLNDVELRQVLGPAPVRKNLEGLEPRNSDFYSVLWPDLQLISSWDSSSSAVWAERLRQKFSKVQFQGKGLWATEGVVTIPFQGKKVLATCSHFYEFRDLETNQIRPAWCLELNRVYQPLLWTSSGLLRYQLADRLKVTGFLGRTPCFEFLGRLRSVDLVGEKVDTTWVQNLFQAHLEWQAIALIAVHEPKPHYVLLTESDLPAQIEKHLQVLHHYQVAREHGQLDIAGQIQVFDPLALARRLGRSDLEGQNKPEVLIELQNLDDLQGLGSEIKAMGSISTTDK